MIVTSWLGIHGSSGPGTDRSENFKIVLVLVRSQALKLFSILVQSRDLKISDKRMLVIFDVGEISNIDETLKNLKKI